VRPLGSRLAGRYGLPPSGTWRLPSAQWLVTATTDVAQLAQILVRRQHDAAAARGVTGLLHTEDALGLGAQIRVRPPPVQPTAVEGLGVPGRVVPEMMQRLAVGPRHDRRHLHHRLVVLPGQQQANQLVAQGHALLRATEAGVEPGTDGINRLGGRRRGLAGRGLAGRGHGSTSSPQMAREVRPLTPRLAARSMPLLTNQR